MAEISYERFEDVVLKVADADLDELVKMLGLPKEEVEKLWEQETLSDLLEKLAEYYFYHNNRRIRKVLEGWGY